MDYNNHNYDKEDQNFQEEPQTTDFEKDQDGQEKQEELIDNDPNSFYSNDKNSDPQKSEYTAEAAESNEEEEDDLDDIDLADEADYEDAEDIKDFEENNQNSTLNS